MATLVLVRLTLSPSSPGTHQLPARASHLPLSPAAPTGRSFLLLFEVWVFSPGSASGSKCHIPSSLRTASSRCQ